MRVERLLTLAALSALTTACVGPVFARCDVRGELEESIDLDGATRIEIEARAGDLVVFGSAGDRVVAQGRICAGSQRRADEIGLEVSRRGDTIAVVVDIPQAKGWSHRNHALLDLRVELPDHIAVHIDDSSGDIDAHDMASLEIDDSSGDIDVRDIAGDLRIDDSSGDIDVRDIGGTFRVTDGSGDVEATNVAHVVIEDDGSGDLRLRDIAGDVTVERDGSGDIRVAGAGGNVTVKRDGSGDIQTTNVSGRVSTPDDH